ncbi:MAG: hypothetical protein QGD92_03795 [Gammaproteobacteria bacterium]|nr:hypothetical protein [Gammaproteobacteria bacterium]
MVEKTEINLYKDLGSTNAGMARGFAVAAVLNLLDAAARGGDKTSLIDELGVAGTTNRIKVMADKIQEALKIED